MNDDMQREAGKLGRPQWGYVPPAVTYLGDLAALTLQTGGKEVGAIDGSTFLGLDTGSVAGTAGT